MYSEVKVLNSTTHYYNKERQLKFVLTSLLLQKIIGRNENIYVGLVLMLLSRDKKITPFI